MGFFRIDHQITSVASSIGVKTKLVSYLDPISSFPAKFRLGDATRTRPFYFHFPSLDFDPCKAGARSTLHPGVDC